MLCGPSQPNAVTVLTSGASPASTWSGSHGLSASFSATQYASFAGLPWVARSPVPGSPPPTFIRTRRTARPIVTLARAPWPKALYPALSPISRAIGPFTTRSGATGCVVAWIESRLKAGSASASMAARSTGKYSGRQPAITAFTAIRSTVASPCRGGRTPTTSRGSRSAKPRNSRTAASVGGTIGSPSVQPRSW